MVCGWFAMIDVREDVTSAEEFRSHNMAPMAGARLDADQSERHYENRVAAGIPACLSDVFQSSQAGKACPYAISANRIQVAAGIHACGASTYLTNEFLLRLAWEYAAASTNSLLWQIPLTVFHKMFPAISLSIRNASIATCAAKPRPPPPWRDRDGC